MSKPFLSAERKRQALKICPNLFNESPVRQRTSLTPPPLTPLSPTPQKLEAECLRGHFPTLILFVLKGIKKFASGRDVYMEYLYYILSS